MATGKINVGKQFIVETVIADNKTIAANSTINIDANASISGYNIVGIVGYDIAAATSGGSNAGSCTIYRLIKYTDTTVRAGVKNWHTSSAAKIKVTFYVLYQTA